MLIVSYGWRSAYNILASSPWWAWVSGGLFLSRDPREKGQLPDGEGATTVTAEKLLQPSVQTAGFTLRDAIRTHSFWMIAGFTASLVFAGRPSPLTWQPTSRIPDSRSPTAPMF